MDQRMMAAILKAQGYRCPYCGDRFGRLLNEGHLDDPERISLEHVWPWHLGGRNFGNILLVHWRCNKRKGGRAPNGCELLALAAVNAQTIDQAMIERACARENRDLKRQIAEFWAAPITY